MRACVSGAGCARGVYYSKGHCAGAICSLGGKQPKHVCVNGRDNYKITRKKSSPPQDRTPPIFFAGPGGGEIVKPTDMLPFSSFLGAFLCREDTILLYMVQGSWERGPKTWLSDGAVQPLYSVICPPLFMFRSWQLPVPVTNGRTVY